MNAYALYSIAEAAAAAAVEALLSSPPTEASTNEIRENPLFSIAQHSLLIHSFAQFKIHHNQINTNTQDADTHLQLTNQSN